VSIDYKIDRALLQPVTWGDYIQKYAQNMTVYVFVDSLFAHVQDLINPVSLVLKLTNKANKQNVIQIVKSFTRSEESGEQDNRKTKKQKTLKQ
jgi:hypothetical protein